MTRNKERRSFLLKLPIIGTAALLVPSHHLMGATYSCSPVKCFDTDFFSFGYRDFFENYYSHCKSASKLKIIPSIEIPSKFRDLFQSPNLYKASNVSSKAISIRHGEYNLFQIDGYLGSQIPFRGLISKPKVVRGTCVVLHGMASNPERCFDAVDRDYMGGIAHRLSEAGYAVWCPFIPQGGNYPSMVRAALYLSSNGLSHHAMLVSLATNHDSVFNSIGLKTHKFHFVYGVSIGAMLAIHALLVDREIKAMVVSGYLRNDDALKSSLVDSRFIDADNFFPAEMNPAFFNYRMPEVFDLMPKIPTLFEVGNKDPYSLAELGRDATYDRAVKAFGNESSLLELTIHPGGHEVVGDAALKWIQGILNKGQFTQRFNNTLMQNQVKLSRS